jgi:hypothetical protein
MLTGATGLVLPGRGDMRCVFMIKMALVVATAGLMLLACGPGYCACTGTPIVPAVSPPLYDKVATEKDHTMTLRVGQRLELVLHAYSGMTTWSQVRTSDSSILAPRVNPAATAVQGVTLAAFQALAPGEADVTAIATPDCAPGQACPMLAMLYTLKVTVTR